MKTLELKPGKDKAVRRFHPWIFSGAIRNLENERVEDGELVRVNDHKGRFLAIGHFHNGSIAVRILTFDEEEINAGFWQKRIQDAFAYRRMLGLPAPGKTTCYRLLHAEGDRLPGLVVDVYNHVAVVQCHSIGMHRSVGEIADAILERAEGDIVAVYDKSSETLPANYAASLENGYIRGDAEPEPVLENGIQFKVDWVTGQKTGFFLDQRINRELLGKFCEGKKVLNCFSYSGGFSLYALKGGAKLVHSVDASARAIEQCNENVALNFRKILKLLSCTVTLDRITFG